MKKNDDARGDRNLLDGYEAVRAFLFAGAATVTVTNTTTHEHLTLRFRTSRRNRRDADAPIWVSVLRKDADTRDGDAYSFFGVVSRKDRRTGQTTTPRFHYAAKKGLANGVKRDDVAVRTASWLVDVANGVRSISPKMEIWHEGLCCYCGTELTQTESVKRGYGPVCARKRGLPWSKPTKTARGKKAKKVAEPAPAPKEDTEALARKVDCPVCTAQAGESCVNSIRVSVPAHGKRLDHARSTDWDPSEFTMLTLFPEPEDLDPHSHEDAAACSTCGRSGSQPCVSGTGRERRRFHANRRQRVAS